MTEREDLKENPEPNPYEPQSLSGDEMLAGQRLGTNTTHNESLVNPVQPQPGPRGPNFVTGAMGEPIPAGEGVVPERPSVGAEDFRTGQAQGEHPDQPPQHPSEVSTEQEPPPVSALKGEWVEHAVAQGEDPETAESKTKAELIEEHGSQPPG